MSRDAMWVSGWLLAAVIFCLPWVLFAQTTCAPETPLGPGRTHRLAPGQSLNQLPPLHPGDNLLFQRGATYHMTKALHLTLVGTQDRPILIGAYGEGARPILDGSRIPQTQHYGLRIEHSSWLIIDGLDFPKHGQPISIVESHHLTMRRSVVRQARAPCMTAKKGSSDIIFEYNVVDGCGLSTSGEGIYIGTDPENTSVEDRVSRVQIRYTTIRDTRTEAVEFKPGVRDSSVEFTHIDQPYIGIHVSHWPGSSYKNAHRIVGNLLTNINPTGKRGGQPPNGIVVKSGAEITKNVVARIQGASGMYIYDAGGNNQAMHVHHNTVYAADEQGIRIGAGRINAHDNLVYRSGGGNFGQDPNFTSPPRFEFTLQARSPANGLGAYAIGEPLMDVGAGSCASGGGGPLGPPPPPGPSGPLPRPTGLRLVGPS